MVHKYGWETLRTRQFSSTRHLPTTLNSLHRHANLDSDLTGFFGVNDLAQGLGSVTAMGFYCDQRNVFIWECCLLSTVNADSTRGAQPQRLDLIVITSTL